MEQLPVHLVSCDPRGLFLAFAAGSSFQVFDLKTNDLVSSEDLKNNNHTGIVRTCSFNRQGDLCVTAGDDKLVKVWNTKDWTCAATRKHTKRISTVAFGPPLGENSKEEATKNDTVVIYADKFGDVYASPITNFENSFLLLGHCSTVSHLILSPKEDYIITADRDEKIRVTHYPRTFDIQSFCLGHTSLVSRLVIPEAFPQFLISGSSDGTICLWDYLSGRLLDTVQIPSNSDTEVKPNVLSLSACAKTNRIAAVIEGLPNVLLYSIDAESKKLTLAQTISCEGGSSSLIFSSDFDSQGRLWIGGKTPLIQVYTFVKGAYVLSTKDAAIAKTIVEHAAKNVTAAEYADVLKSLSLEQMRKKDHDEFMKMKQAGKKTKSEN